MMKFVTVKFKFTHNWDDDEENINDDDEDVEDVDDNNSDDDDNKFIDKHLQYVCNIDLIRILFKLNYILAEQRFHFAPTCIHS